MSYEGLKLARKKKSGLRVPGSQCRREPGPGPPSLCLPGIHTETSVRAGGDKPVPSWDSHRDKCVWADREKSLGPLPSTHTHTENCYPALQEDKCKLRFAHSCIASHAARAQRMRRGRGGA